MPRKVWVKLCFYCGMWLNYCCFSKWVGNIYLGKCSTTPHTSEGLFLLYLPLTNIPQCPSERSIVWPSVVAHPTPSIYQQPLDRTLPIHRFQSNWPPLNQILLAGYNQLYTSYKQTRSCTFKSCCNVYQSISGWNTPTYHQWRTMFCLDLFWLRFPRNTMF